MKTFLKYSNENAEISEDPVDFVDMADFEEGEDYIEADDIQRRALLEAARDGNTDMVERLLNRKIYPDIVVNQSTALNQAVLNSRIDVVKLLLQRKANIEKPDAGGQHPLMKCARSGKNELCTLLLEVKAEPNAVDSVLFRLKCTTYLIAQYRYFLFFFRIVTTHTSQYGQSALHKAARHGHDKICAMLIENKADLNVSETVACSCNLLYFVRLAVETVLALRGSMDC